jgi:hypothetical protein
VGKTTIRSFDKCVDNTIPTKLPNTVSDLIPRNLPYGEFSRDEIDTANMTWFDYITGRFCGEMWYEQYRGAQELIDPMRYWPIPFPEEPTTPHLLFSGEAIKKNSDSDVTSVEDEYQNFEQLRMFPDAQCRFDIWLLYHHPPEEVEFAEGTARIDILPKQEEVKIPPLTDTVPSDVPLIYGPKKREERSKPHRPFARNTPEIPNFTTMADRRERQHQEYRQRKKRQQRQDAQHQRMKRQKWEKAQRQRKKRQQRQYAQHQQKSVKKHRSRR